ncbi:hypothetical protein HDU76_007762 [Blyttiomyces sp. JEL0837]|nr:hypothetical protein HDU76_007762 [Blyttiomyces sp. JEL0837]
MSQFFKDAAAGNLPQFSWIDPNYANGAALTDIFGQPSDGSPGSDYARAEGFLKAVYEALVNSPQWQDTLLLVTFDEHGGSYDHVPPPTGVPSPDDIAANSNEFKFNRLGVRVPTLAISPWIQKGSVIHKPTGPFPNSEFEHSSLSATLKNIFNLPDFLTKRDEFAGTFDEFTRVLSSPRTDCIKQVPDAPAFAEPESGLFHDISIGDLPALIKDVQQFLKDI